MLKQREKIVKAKSITCAPKPQRGLGCRPHRDEKEISSLRQRSSIFKGNSRLLTEIHNE